MAFLLIGVDTLKQVDPFYKSKRWQKKRQSVLRKHDYLSAEAKRYGQSKQAEMIHHIYPKEQYPELALVDWNLLPLTNREHNTFHDRNTDEIIGRGIYWQQKFKNEFENFYNPPLDENSKMPFGDR